MSPELAIRVSEGAVNAHTEWYLAVQGVIGVGTTPLKFLQADPQSVPSVFGEGKCLSRLAAHDGENAVAGGYWSYADGGGGLFSFQVAPPEMASLANPGSLAQVANDLTTSATTPIVVTGKHPFATGQAINISGWHRSYRTAAELPPFSRRRSSR